MKHQPWQVGGSNDVRHHWFLFRYTSADLEFWDGAGAVGRKGKYLIYRTKKQAQQALRELETMQTPNLNDLFAALEQKLRAIGDDRMLPEAQLEKLREEVAEVAHEIRYPDMTRMVRSERVLKEAADVVIVAAMLCRAFGLDWEDLMGAVEYKMQINARRTWAAHNGTARHVGDSVLPGLEE